MPLNSRRILFQLLSIGFLIQSTCSQCNPRKYGFGSKVCVCNADYCDILPPLVKVDHSKYVAYTTNKDDLRLKKYVGNISDSIESVENVIEIDDDKIYQKIIGFGGAFTDSTGFNIESLSEKARENILRSYFSSDGLEYNLCRVPIGGTDFSNRSYSYDDSDEPDLNLTKFNLTSEDFQYKIPYIKWAQNLTNNNLKLFCSAWTTPKWMKITGQQSGPFGFLSWKMYEPWAKYYLKFLDAYDKEGIQFWGLTTGNEPSLTLVPTQINSVSFNTGRFIKILTPFLEHSKFSKIKKMIIDDQRLFYPWLPDLILSDQEVDKSVDGMAVHWYYNNIISASVLTTTHEKHPEKFILSTEASNGANFWENDVELGSWSRGESYAQDIIENLNNWVSAWVDWNLVLDMQGGPTYIKNFLDSPIIVNAKADEFYKQPTYYVLAHFSKFIPRDSIKIGCTQLKNNKILTTAFKRPDNNITVILLNKDSNAIDVVICDIYRGRITINLSPKSITTVVYNRKKSYKSQICKHEKPGLLGFVTNILGGK